MIEFTYKADVPRNLLDEGNVVLPWKKERKLRVRRLESHKEQARQNAKFRLAPGAQFWAWQSIDRCKSFDDLRDVCSGYALPNTWIKETKPVISKTDELKLLKDQQKDLAKRIEKLEFGKWGKEPSNGAMFKIEKKFSSLVTAHRYSYLAVKAAGSWYLTGTSADANKFYTWEGLKKFAGQYSRVWRLTVAEELLD